MTFTFIHTADWQIGKTFGRFDTELSRRLRDERLEAIDRIAQHAKSVGARHVLVAGDIWDQETPSDKTLHATLERLADASELTWWLLPGNHDPARPNGLWSRIGNDTVFQLPSNVRPLLSNDPVALESDVYVLPAPMLSKTSASDPTGWMDDSQTPTGALRIGLAHGGVHGFGDQDSAEDAIAATRVASARLDYLALGDWHGRKQIAERIWYSGTPEPDRFPRNEPGYCLAVTLSEPGAVPNVTSFAVAKFTWLKQEIVVTPGMTSEELFETALAGQPPSQKTLLELKLSGRIKAPDASALLRDIEIYKERLAYLEVRQHELTTLVETADLDRLDHAGSLRAAGEELLRQSADQALSAEDQADARQALALLFSFADRDETQEAGA